MAAEAHRRGAGHIRQMVILGDGAAWIWNLAGQHFPEATQIVDLFHAREHLHDLAKLLEFMLSGGKDDWPPAWLSWMTATSRRSALPPAPSPWTARKPGTSKPHWATSSTTPAGCVTPTSASSECSPDPGPWEAGCKAVIGQRLKQSGMHWTVNGADAIITLRCAQASEQWEAISNHRHNQTGAA